LFGPNKTARRVKRIEDKQTTFFREALGILRNIERTIKKMSTEMDDLEREVQESTAVQESAISLITGLAQQIRDLKDEPAKLEELANKLDTSSAALAAAVAANTVAEDEPPVEDPPAGATDTTT